MNPGDTFLGALPGDTRHLWVVISSPNTAREVAIVNLTSHKPGCDTSCKIYAGEHPIVSHDTVIEYNKGNMAKVNDLSKALKMRLLILDTPVSPSLLLRIQRGALASIYCKKAIQAAVKATLS